MRALLWVHPAVAAATIVLAARQATLGLRIRRRAPGAGTAAARHRAAGPWLYALVLANWLGGLASLRWLRPEYEAAASAHFRLASLLCAVFTAVLLLAWRLDRDPRARDWHAAAGAVALVLAGVQAFLGLQLLP
jgi:uncharacterized membrane protein YozB (DUF420 family)